LELEIKNERGRWENLRFIVDSGTEMTTMSAADAKNRSLPVPVRPVPGLNFQGQEVRAGLLRARVVGMDQTEYLFPCYFLGDPNILSVGARSLLGLTGVINQIRIAFDGTSSIVAPHGVLVVEKK
jgi:hypothetical protein